MLTPLRMKTWFIISFVSLTMFSTNCFANVIGTDMQTFHPSHNGKTFVTVNSGETLEKYELHLGLFANYAFNSLVYYKNNTEIPQSRSNLNDRVGTIDLNIGFGILDWWDIGFSAPFVIDQDVKQEGARIQYLDKGNTELRVATKFRLLQKNDLNLALLGSFNLKRTENNPFTGDDSFNVFNIEAAVDKTFNNIQIAANLGFRYRSKGSSLSTTFPGVEPLNHQILASLAASYSFANQKTKLIGELYSSFPTEDTDFNSDRSLSVLEVLFSVKQELRHKFWLHAGVGTELSDGLFTPDWRGFVGLHWDINLNSPVVAALPTPALTPIVAAPFPEQAPKPAKTIVLRNAVFALNSSSILLGSSQSEISKIADYLNNNSFNNLVIEGHSCDLGSSSYNKRLSQKRAAKIKSILVNQHGITSNKIVTLGIGESRPEVPNTSEKNRQFNRRVEFKIYK